MTAPHQERRAGRAGRPPETRSLTRFFRAIGLSVGLALGPVGCARAAPPTLKAPVAPGLQPADPVLSWNEAADHPVLSGEHLRNLEPGRRDWEVGQMVWPSSQEVAQSRVQAPREDQRECIEWIRKLLKPGAVPTGAEEHLVAMRRWEGQLEGLGACDAFILRWRTRGRTFHIWEAPPVVVVSVSNGQPGRPRPRREHRDSVAVTASAVLSPHLAPPAFPHSRPLRRDARLTAVKWKPDETRRGSQPESTGTSDAGAARMRAFVISAVTDGRFVCFQIFKRPRTARPVLISDPRFPPVGTTEQ